MGIQSPNNLNTRLTNVCHFNVCGSPTTVLAFKINFHSLKKLINQTQSVLPRDLNKVDYPCVLAHIQCVVSLCVRTCVHVSLYAYVRACMRYSASLSNLSESRLAGCVHILSVLSEQQIHQPQSMW